ncbi:hypothetical protein AVEN_135851-1 [Araneus ventricosus]|uniref:Uncharacterized protein n=1 Tax=Araneus ventricosus TaxID=182803 RepID=A0A4Y2SSF6_ARAVE|nr:hypothetical protein AVEN_135851-1 [Araneus ventricosus]
MDKVRLLPSGVQGLVPTEAALSSFTMKPHVVVLDVSYSTCSCLQLDQVQESAPPTENHEPEQDFQRGSSSSAPCMRADGLE